MRTPRLTEAQIASEEPQSAQRDKGWEEEAGIIALFHIPPPPPVPIMFIPLPVLDEGDEEIEELEVLLLFLPNMAKLF